MLSDVVYLRCTTTGRWIGKPFGMLGGVGQMLTFTDRGVEKPGYPDIRSMVNVSILSYLILSVHIEEPHLVAQISSRN